MIDFACKKFEIEEVIRCSLALNKSDYKILYFLMQNEDRKFSSQELASKLKFELSTIQRSVKKLFEKDLLTRSQINLDRGYTFVYRIKDKKKLKGDILKIVHAWVSQVEDGLKGI